MKKAEQTEACAYCHELVEYKGEDRLTWCENCQLLEGKTVDLSCPSAADARLSAAAPELYAFLDSAPVIRLGETLEQFKERYQAWMREVNLLLKSLEGRDNG